MKSRTTVRDTAEAFCEAWFVQRDPDRALAYMAEDIDFVGMGDGESVQGKAAMREYLGLNIPGIPESFELESAPIHQHLLREDMCSPVSYTHLTLPTNSRV